MSWGTTTFTIDFTIFCGCHFENVSLYSTFLDFIQRIPMYVCSNTIWNLLLQLWPHETIEASLSSIKSWMIYLLLNDDHFSGVFIPCYIWLLEVNKSILPEVTWLGKYVHMPICKLTSLLWNGHIFIIYSFIFIIYLFSKCIYYEF